jgi:hypothetical protein
VRLAALLRLLGPKPQKEAGKDAVFQICVTSASWIGGRRRSRSNTRGGRLLHSRKLSRPTPSLSPAVARRAEAISTRVSRCSGRLRAAAQRTGPARAGKAG